MQSKWLTYGFLTLMAVALVSLAVLQYRWLGSVSEAEKERLEETLDASTENFVAELNRNFGQLTQAFRIQVTNEYTDMETPLGASYLDWLSNSTYPDLVDTLYYIRDLSGETEVQLFSSDPLMLRPVMAPPSVEKWIRDQKEHSIDPTRFHQVNLISRPDFGEPSFLAVPIQLIDVITIDNASTGQNLRVNLNVDQLDDVILIQMDDRVLKDQLIENIARTYFSESYRDQYILGLVQESGEDTLSYFSSEDLETIPNPDFKKGLRILDFSSIMVFKETADFSDQRRDELISSLDSLVPRLERVELHSMSENERVRVGARVNSEGEANTLVRNSEWNYQVRGEGQIDTTITRTFSADLSFPAWQLWLSFKEGSLDAFVSKARNRNLGISFGILAILGVSVVMIVVFAQRSRDLAEKQMLFVAGVSHELRTPLTVIRSAAENLTEGVVQDENRVKKYAELMLQEGRRLSDMVDQIMEFSGIQSGKRIYQFTDVHPEELIKDLIEASRPGLEEKQIRLEYSLNGDLKTIKADREALLLSLMNLIQNAIKFSNRGEKIFLRYDEIKHNGKKSARFQVQDFGAGIPEDEQESIFEPFYRGRLSVENQVKGNGIGLSLVRKVVKAHQGGLSLKSKIGQGSTFTIILPLKQHGN